MSIISLNKCQVICLRGKNKDNICNKIIFKNSRTKCNYNRDKMQEKKKLVIVVRFV